MKELVNTISSFIDKFTTYAETLFTSVEQAITEMKTWLDYLPVGLIGAAGIILVLLVVFRILGR